MNKLIDIVLQPQNNVYEKDWYRPMEIAKLGLIRSNARSNNPIGNYHFILRQIARGNLQATDYSKEGAKPYYKVHFTDIEKFNKGGKL